MYGIPPCIQVCHRCTLGVSGELNDEISWNGLEFIKLNSSCYIITNCVMHLYHVHSCLKVLCNVIEAGPHCVLTFCTQLFSQLQEDVILGDLLLQKMFIENMCTDIFYIQDFWKNTAPGQLQAAAAAALTVQQSTMPFNFKECTGICDSRMSIKVRLEDQTS